MSSFFARRGGPRQSARPAVPPRVGHFYLALQEQRLYCLNDTARQLVREGVPLTARDLERQPLTSAEGLPVAARDLPLFRAAREGVALDAVYLMESAGRPAQVLSWHASPLRGTDDKVTGVIGSLTVPPPEPDWEELAGLAHDLGTPLQSLRNLVPVIQTSPLLGPAAEAVERLRSAAERAITLGQDLVDFCRAPAFGTPRGKRDWAALAPMLERLVAEQLSAAARKNIRLETDLGAAAGVEIHTDTRRLTRLVANLLVNAVRYTSAGYVRLSAAPHDSGALVLTVEDTGAGIAADDPESIFQPYQRGRASKSDTDSGSGLGLAVIDRLIGELEFTLEVYSEHGQGSRFDVIIPGKVLRPAPG